MKQKIWIITDTHFNHDKLMELEYGGRPLNFQEILLLNLQKIPATDTLIHLGDICIGKDEEMHKKFIEPLTCRKILVRGNHDSKSLAWYSDHGWDFASDGLRLKMFGKHILLTHIPQKDDGWYDINIHGHFHNSDHRRHEPELQAIKNDKQKLLAIEYTNYAPVNLENFI